MMTGTSATPAQAEGRRSWRLGPRSGRAAAALVTWAARGPERIEPVRAWWLNPLTPLLLAALAVYRHAVPNERKPDCRFTPSCSRYASLALRKYGTVGGVRATARRLRRCLGAATPIPVDDWP